MLTQNKKSVKVEKRVEAIRKFLDDNAGRIETMGKGKIEIHFSGKGLTISVTEYVENFFRKVFDYKR